MRKNFKLPNLRNSASVIRLSLGALVFVNLIAGYFILRPPGGSVEDLRNQIADLQVQVRQRMGSLQRTRMLAGKVQTGRGEGEQFLSQYFMPRRTAYSAILMDLSDAAKKAQMHPKDSSYGTEPVEGSDTLSMMQISANYEGTYANLINFINLIDKSNRLLILESLNATPQQGNNLLNINLKLDTFVRDDGSEI